MSRPTTLSLHRIQLTVPDDPRPLGARVLAGMLQLAATVMHNVEQESRRRGRPLAALSRLRGTGRGIHFADSIHALESAHPIRLESPFEGSQLVAGGVWVGQELLGESQSYPAALAKLRWSAGADDLPLHVHDRSDRVIVVLEGRGFFHVSDDPPDSFTGRNVRSIPARERDVFAFTRGLLHTFSTADHAMTLLSCQLPYVRFDDPDQYRLAHPRWTARDNPEPSPPRLAIDPNWTLLIGGC